ncbi:MAG: thermonuclease family protein [Planctomycetaceae bacterium]|nr:thermonuclease family protein [Planctomycetaceae bacterium]
MARKISRPLRYRVRRPLAIVGLLLLFVLLRLLASDVSRPSGPESLSEGAYRVQRVVDGDTLLLEGGARVRLIGADTPETVQPNHAVEPYGPEATAYTEQFVHDAGGEVRLQMDRERKDRFDRFLAYVFAGDRMLNEELIRAGLATARTEFDYSESMKRRFRRAEEAAKAAELGIWNSNSP